MSYRVVDEGSYGITTQNWTSVPGGFSLVTSNEMATAYNAAFDALLKANIKGKELADIKIALTRSYNYSSSYQYSLMCATNTVILETNAKGNGIAKGKSSWCGMYLDAEVVQIDPSFQNGATFQAFIMQKTRDAIDAAKGAVTSGNPLPGRVLSAFYGATAKSLENLSIVSFGSKVSPLLQGHLAEAARDQKWMATMSRAKIPSLATTATSNGGAAVNQIGQWRIPAPDIEDLTTDQVLAKIKTELAAMKASGGKEK